MGEEVEKRGKGDIFTVQCTLGENMTLEKRAETKYPISDKLTPLACV